MKWLVISTKEILVPTNKLSVTYFLNQSLLINLPIKHLIRCNIRTAPWLPDASVSQGSVVVGQQGMVLNENGLLLLLYIAFIQKT